MDELPPACEPDGRVPLPSTRTVTDDGLLLRAQFLIDGISGEAVEDAALLIEGERIAAVGRGADFGVFRGPVLDLGTRTLLPGLIDAHAHLAGRRSFAPAEAITTPHDLMALRAAEDARRALAAGFTTVRDAGGMIALSLRAAVEEGSVPGPRIFAAGPMISQTGGHGDAHYLSLAEARRLNPGIADGVDACRAAVRFAARMGADWIKICTTGGIGSARDHPWDVHFTAAEVEAVVDEAHRLGKRVGAHAQGRDGVLAAVRAGVDAIEHGYWIDEECVEEMLARGTFLVPTLALVELFKRAIDEPLDMPPWRLRKQRDAIGAMERAFALACEARLPLAAGPDYMGPAPRNHGANADEAITMAKYGLPPVDALRAATIGGARVLGIEDDAGTLQPGKWADVIAVEGDPTRDPEALRRVACVIKAGVIHQRPGP